MRLRAPCRMEEGPGFCHSGIGAIKAAMTPIRVVCQNTLNLALSTAKRSWANVDTIRLDTKRIKEEQPELYRKFSRAASSRRFRVLIAEISGINGLD